MLPILNTSKERHLTVVQKTSTQLWEQGKEQFCPSRTRGKLLPGLSFMQEGDWRQTAHSRQSRGTAGDELPAAHPQPIHESRDIPNTTQIMSKGSELCLNRAPGPWVEAPGEARQVN